VARITCRRVEPIFIEFEDQTVECIINIDALIIFQEEFGMDDLVKEVGASPYELGAKLLYSGIKTNRPDFTLDEARVIICSAGSELLGLITDAFVKCCGNVGGEEFTKKYLKEIEKLIQKQQ
jgi:hypothetical protein